MSTTHLSEQEIQHYAEELNGGASDKHLAGCPDCQLRLTIYKAMFSTIHDMDQPAFDFDLAALVLDQLPMPKPQYAWLPGFAVALSVISISAMSLIYGPVLARLIKEMSPTWTLLILCPATITALFQGLSAYQDFRKKITLIEIQDFAT